MATIRRRSGGYNVQIRKQGYSTITKTFSSITTARKWAAGVEADMERRLYIEVSENITLLSVLIRYQDEVIPLHTGGVISLHEEPLFTYSARGVSGAFLKRCRRSGIEDLRFHDLRHEATSRLFEKGLNPVEVATITGHKDPRMLMRYTHLRAEDLARKLG